MIPVGSFWTTHWEAISYIIWTYLCRCGGAACQSFAPLLHNSPLRCSRARTRTRPDARAPSATPACCCRAAWPPGAPSQAAGPRPSPAGCGCGAYSGSVRGPPRCAGTSARPGWWSGTCWTPPPATHRRTGAEAAAARGGGATLSGEETEGQRFSERPWRKSSWNCCGQCRRLSLKRSLKNQERRNMCVKWFKI